MGRQRTGSLRVNADGTFTALITVGPPGSQKRKRMRLYARDADAAQMELAQIVLAEERRREAVAGGGRPGCPAPSGDPVLDRFVRVAHDDGSRWASIAVSRVLPRLSEAPATTGDLVDSAYDRDTRQALAWAENAGLLLYSPTDRMWRLRRTEPEPKQRAGCRPFRGRVGCV